MSTINISTKSANPVDDIDYTWEVKANNRAFHEKFRKKGIFCLQRNKYADNRIKTSKYNVLTFLPLNLYEQYHKAHVVYFTCLLILQCIPQISTLPSYVIILPLLCILLVKGLRDLVDDIARHRSDKLINNKPCEILTDGSLRREKWKNIQVGDIVCLHNDDSVPADILLLYSTEPNSLCYVETAGIDGETNLKFRQSLVVTHTLLQTEPALAKFDGLVTCETPNVRLHRFVGTLDWNTKKYPLNNENLLLRGCTIRNTAHCYGLVIYAGFDTKIMKNSGKMIMKKSKLDDLINKMVISIAVMLVSVSICMGIGAGVWDRLWLDKHSYITGHRTTSSATVGFFLFWGYFTTISTLVPFFLYISMDLIHVLHNYFINNDLEMYHADTDTPAQVRGNSLSDLLGQIEYIFTDKTGTLTQNVMTFKKCCVGQKIFGTIPKEEDQEVSFAWNEHADRGFRFYDQSLIEEVCKDEDPVLREFFRLVALCHTVMVEEKEGDLVYQAASPDEAALVTAARNFGYVLLSRTQDSITISELGTCKTYGVLAIMDFNSVRKRMSVLVRDPEGKIRLYTKGADNVILERVNPDCKTDVLMNALDGFAEDTLRTLCLAYKDVEEHVYEQWRSKHQEASVSLQNREEQLGAVYEDMETDLQLLGATAIEDKLQEGVPETIQLLREGNMKVWMLTGDKQDTAVNIGYSCRLLTSDMQIVDESDIRSILDHSMESTTERKDVPRGTDFPGREEAWGNRALVLTGDFLSSFLDCEQEPEMSLWRKLRRKGEPSQRSNQRGLALVELACRCQTVICCRVTPKQKASIVQLVRSNKKVTTLAIGDGGNDVNMIKTAHVGVGISGNEGLQAVLASDFAVAQFCFLQRLLFVHGRWSYFRLSKFLRYYNYKTFTSLVHNIWFGFFNAFSALPAFESWYLVFNAVLYTLYPTLCMGILDQDVDSRTSLQHPELYTVGQRDLLFNMKMFFLSVLYGTYTSLVMFFIPYAAFIDSAGPWGLFDYQVFSFTMSTIATLSVLAEAVIELSSWSVFAFLAIILCLTFYFLISYVTGLPSAYMTNFAYFNFLGVMRKALSSGFIWLIFLLAVAVAIIPSLFCRSWLRLTTPSKKEAAPVKTKPVELQSEFKRNALRRSSYAFSYSEGIGTLISRGTSLRSSRAQPRQDVPQED